MLQRFVDLLGLGKGLGMEKAPCGGLRLITSGLTVSTWQSATAPPPPATDDVQLSPSSLLGLQLRAPERHDDTLAVALMSNSGVS
jgi:hypothetical protein